MLPPENRQRRRERESEREKSKLSYREHKEPRHTSLKSLGQSDTINECRHLQKFQPPLKALGCWGWQLYSLIFNCQWSGADTMEIQLHLRLLWHEHTMTGESLKHISNLYTVCSTRKDTVSYFRSSKWVHMSHLQHLNGQIQISYSSWASSIYIHQCP